MPARVNLVAGNVLLFLFPFFSFSSFAHFFFFVFVFLLPPLIFFFMVAA